MKDFNQDALRMVEKRTLKKYDRIHWYQNIKLPEDVIDILKESNESKKKELEKINEE
jgi:hypothetical protein